MKIILAGILAFIAAVSAASAGSSYSSNNNNNNNWGSGSSSSSNNNNNNNKWGSGSSSSSSNKSYNTNSNNKNSNSNTYNSNKNYNSNTYNSSNNNKYQDNFMKDVVYKSGSSDYAVYTRYGQRAGYNKDGWEDDGYWGSKLTQVREACAAEFYKDLTYLAKSIRLVFHDCFCGCDGAIDMTHPDNAGLDLIIELLYPIAYTYRHWFSRVDIWQICALTALDISTSLYEQNAPTYKMYYIGRKDAPNADFMGYGGEHCDVYGGPSMNSKALVSHFNQYFGFDARCTAAVMGTHGMSLMHPWYSGHGDGLNPAQWAQGTTYVLDNWYFKGFKNPWTYELRANIEYPQIGPKQQWYWEPSIGYWDGDGYVSGKLVMLDTDVSLAWDASQYQDENGYTYCKVSYEAKHHGPAPASSVPLCPKAYETYDIVEEYAADNMKFLYDLEYCMNKMFNTGYRSGYDDKWKMYYSEGGYYM